MFRERSFKYFTCLLIRRKCAIPKDCYLACFRYVVLCNTPLVTDKAVAVVILLFYRIQQRNSVVWFATLSAIVLYKTKGHTVFAHTSPHISMQEQNLWSVPGNLCHSVICLDKQTIPVEGYNAVFFCERKNQKVVDGQEGWKLHI